MNFTDLRRRLSRIETGRGGTVPTRITADRPMDEPDPLAGPLANWREWVADGRASVSGGILWITAPEMTMEAWEARFCTEEHERLH